MGCQNAQPQPKNKNIYPVPVLRVSIVRPVFTETGTKIEYIAEHGKPTARTYLTELISEVQIKEDQKTTHKHIQNVDKALRFGDQFNGSSG